MRLIEKAYLLALEDLKLDWRELPGQKSNPLITECYKAVDGLDNPEMIDDSETAWCSCWMNKKIQDAGGKGTRSAGARSWLRWGLEVQEPHVGDIVIFKRGNSKWQAHVAFINQITPKYLVCLGANQKNMVCLQKYDRKNILGYRTSKD